MLTVGLLFCFIHSSNGNEWVESINNVTISVQLKSGKISFSNDHNQLEINFGKISEIALDGITQVGISGPEKHQFPTFLYQDFVASPLEEVGVYGLDRIRDVDRNITAMRKIFQVKKNLVGPAAYFAFEILSYNNDTTIQNERTGERYQVFNGTIRLNIIIGRWKFCGQNIQCKDKDQKNERGQFLDFELNFKGDEQLRDPIVRTGLRATSFVPGAKRPLTYDYGGVDVTPSFKYQQNITWPVFPSQYPDVNGNTMKLRFARFPFDQTVIHTMYFNVSTNDFVAPSSSVMLKCQYTLILLLGAWFIMLSVA